MIPPCVPPYIAEQSAQQKLIPDLHCKTRIWNVDTLLEVKSLFWKKNQSNYALNFRNHFLFLGIKILFQERYNWISENIWTKIFQTSNLTFVASEIKVHFLQSSFEGKAGKERGYLQKHS